MDRETLTRDSVIALLLHLQMQTSASQHSVCMSLEEFRQLAAIGRDWLDLRVRLDAAEQEKQVASDIAQAATEQPSMTEELARLKAFETRVRDVIAGAAPRPIGGQHVGVQRYQMTPSTLKEFHRIIRDHGSVNASLPAPPSQEEAKRDG